MPFHIGLTSDGHDPHVDDFERGLLQAVVVTEALGQRPTENRDALHHDLGKGEGGQDAGCVLLGQLGEQTPDLFLIPDQARHPRFHPRAPVPSLAADC